MDYFELIIFGFFLGLGLFVGGYTERRHIRSLDEREASHRDIFVTQLKSFPEAVVGPTPPAFFVGEVVIATDYLKTFLTSIRKIFGGEMRSYQTLLTRARREALLRVVEQAHRGGYNAVCNVRFDGLDVGGNSKGRRAAMVTMMASATAYHRSTAP